MAITGSSFTGLMLMLLLTLPDSTGACPRPCACYAPGEVHCTFRSLIAVPAGISTRVQRVNLGFNAINHMSVVSFGGLRRLELLMMHGNNLQKIPDGAFQDLVSLQILKMSYNKLSVITGHSFSGLTGLIRLHLDHNRIEFIHPDAFGGMTSLRLLHLEGNHLQKLHPATFSTFSLLQRFHISTLKHLYLSDNLLSTLPKEMMGNLPQLENIFLYGNPWSCDCRMRWLQDWKSSGVLKCKKDRTFSDGQLCPRCSSPKQLMGKDISDVKEFICTGPAISSSGKDILHEENISELLPIDRIKEPFGNVSFSLSDEHGTKADLLCQILEPRDSTKISWNYTKSQQIAANMTLFFDVECTFDRDNYESLWRLLAYYSEVPLHLRREIMLTREPELSYRYKQDIEKDAFYYTGVRANVLARPSWLMQSFMNVKLNRPYSSSKSVRLILNTHVSTITDEDLIRQQKRPWVMIEHDNKTQTTFSCVVGGMIEMNCVVHSSEDAAVQWMLPDGSRVKVASSTPHSRVTVSSTGKLHIKSINHGDVGVYYCIAEVVGDVDIVPFRLAVVDSSTPLQGEEIGSAITRFVGESAALPCLSVAAPDAVVNWIFPDGSILNSKANSSRALIYSNGTLFIPYSQLNNNGYHKCVALNQYGVDVLATKLTVLGRKRIQPLQPYPSKPQSAAGVSTRVNVFLEDVEEASGDDSNTQEGIQTNRIFMNRRRGPNATTRGHSFSHGRSRRPFRKQNKTDFANQRSANTKSKMDPHKWANILAKIRKKSASKNTSLHIVQDNTSVNVESPGLIDNTEGSSPDDSSQHAYNTQTVKVTAHVEEENKNINQTAPLEVNTSADKMTYITSPQSVSNYGITEINVAEERHVGTISGERIENNQIYSSPVIRAPSEREIELNFSKTGAIDSWENSSSLLPTTLTSNTGQEAPPGSVQFRARSNLSSRQRFGSRGQIKLRRPFLKSAKSRPRSSYIYPTILAGDTKVYPTSGAHIYTTIPRGDTKVYSTSGTTGPIYPTIQTGDTNVHVTSGTTYPIFTTIPTGDASIYPATVNNAHKYPKVTTGDTSVYPTTGAHIYPTIPTGDIKVYSRQRFGSRQRIKLRRPFLKPAKSRPRSSYIYPTILAGDTKVYPTSGAHIYTTIPRGDTKVYSTAGITGPIYPTVQTGDTNVHVTSGTTDLIYTTIPSGDTNIHVTSGTTDPIYTTIPTGDASIYSATVNNAHKYPKVTTGDTSVYPTTGAHIYPTIPTGDIKLYSRQRFGSRQRIKLRRPFLKPAKSRPRSSYIYPTILAGDTKVYPTSGAHIYTTIPRGDTKVYSTSGITGPIYPTVQTGDTNVYSTPGATDPIYTAIPTGDTNVHVTSGTTDPICTTIPTGDTNVYSTSGATDPIYTAIPTGDTNVHVTSGTTDPICTTIPTGHASIYPATVNNAHKYPKVTTGDTSVYPTTGGHIYPTIPTGDIKLYSTSGTTFPIHPTIPTGDASIYPTNSEIEATGSSFTLNPGKSLMDVLHLPESHSDGQGENHASSRTRAGENTFIEESVTSVPPQINSLLPLTHKFNDLPIQNQVSFPLTTEAPTKSISSVGRQKSFATSSHTPVANFIENNDFILKSVSEVDYREQPVLTHDKPLIVPAASTDSSPVTTVPTSATKISITTQNIGTTPSIDLPTATTLSLTNTERSAVQLTPGLSLQDNRIPFHSRNHETNYIEVRENGRTSITNNKYPYYIRQPSGNIQPSIIKSSSVDIYSAKNIQTTTTAVLDSSSLTTSSSSTQSKQKIQTEKESVNKKWSEVLSQTHQTLSTLQKRPRITTAKFHTVTVDAGSHLQVPCDSVGEPQPFLSWTKVSTGAIMLASTRIQRFEVHSNGTFVIHNVQLQDRGQYLCIARNLYGSDRMTVTLVVLAHVPRVTLPRHRDVMVHLGKSVVLECQAQGLPTPNISWVLPDRSVVRTVSGSERRVMLLANGSLEIKHTNYMDRGVYKCIASNAAGADMLSVRLQISALPPMIHQQSKENRTVPDGQAVYIHCTSEGFPSPTLRWVTFNGTQIRPSQFINDNLFVFPNGTLYIRKPTEQDSGNYECVAVNSVGVAMRSVSLQVKGNSSMAKIISTSAQITNVQYGGQLSLDCTAAGSPNPRIIWRTPSKKLLDAHYSFDRRMKVFSNGSLTIRPVTEKDEGDYLCVARNKMGDDYLLLTVKVITKAAKIEHKPLNHHKVSYGGELKVDCIASGLPNPEIAWSLPDGTVINSVLQSDDSGVRSKRYVVFDNGTLYFNEVGMKEEGDYTCYAENRIGKDEMKVNIRVVASVPVIHNNTADAIRVPYGKTAVLTCRAEGKPAPTITWMSPVNRVISAVSDKHRVTEDGTLHVQKVQRFDAGNYTCLARNAVGMDRKVIHVEVEVDVPVINGLKEPGTIRRTAMKDRDVLLDCRTEGNPVPQITWVLPNNVALPAPHYGSRITVHRNGTLEIRAARKSDSSVFLCIARNEGGEAKLQIQLHVTEDIEKPRLRDLPVEHIPITDGVLVTLNCSVDGRPTPEVTWILPNGTSLLRGSGIFRFHHKLDGSLLIRQPSVSEAGRYRCVAHNSAGYVERIVMLESGGKPDILNKYNSLVSIINGENLELNCQSSGNPQPELTWILPSGVILTRPQQTGRYAVLNNGTLSVQRASVYDRGIYVCQTTNRHGSSSLKVSVIVIAYPPRITSGPAPVTYAKPGAPLQLNCLVLATPKAEVNWEMPDGIQFKVGMQTRLYGNKYLHPQGSLIIQNPSKKDNGLYKCTAKNVVGSDSKATYVYVF